MRRIRAGANIILFILGVSLFLGVTSGNGSVNHPAFVSSIAMIITSGIVLLEVLFTNQ